MAYVYIFLDLLVGLILLFIMTKLLGKTQISQITPFEFVSALVMGELVGNAIFDREIGVMMIVFAVLVWGALLIGVEKLELKVLKWRGILEGNPSVVIREGIVDREQLRKNNMTLNQLQNLLRQKDVFSIREVHYALLEPNGMVTVMKKPQYETPNRLDFQMEGQLGELPITLIIDGQLIDENLNLSGFSRAWLDNELTKLGFLRIEDVFFAEWLSPDGLFVISMDHAKNLRAQPAQ